MVRYLMILLLWLIGLQAENEIHYNLQTNLTTPYQYQPILLDVNISQEDHTKVMFFNFTPQESEAYRFYQIDLREVEAHEHDLKHLYRYLIYPTQSGSVEVTFKLIQTVTDDEKIAYTVFGHRELYRKLEKKEIEVAVDPIKLEVKPLPDSFDLVGDFTLAYQLDKVLTDAYDPIHLTIDLKGWGEVPSIVWIPPDNQYHVFTQTPQTKILHSDKGTFSEMHWDYAISAKDDFNLSAISLNLFNPQTQQRYKLELPQQNIKVNPVDTTLLVDQEDSPAAIHSMDWSWLVSLMSYLVVFVAGYLMPREFWKRQRIVAKSEEKIWAEKVAAVQTHKELLKLLLSENKQEYFKAIEALESVLYNGKRISLQKIKGML